MTTYEIAKITRYKQINKQKPRGTRQWHAELRETHCRKEPGIAISFSTQLSEMVKSSWQNSKLHYSKTRHTSQLGKMMWYVDALWSENGGS